MFEQCQIRRHRKLTLNRAHKLSDFQLHLATCDSQAPHVSLMNYTYLSSTPFSNDPTIIMTTNPSSKKTMNLVNNPRVSLLVHDWVSHRPPTRPTDGSPPRQPGRSSLATLLLNLNTSELSSISATISGNARILEQGSEEERWCKEKHTENNTFDDQAREERGMFGRNQDQHDSGTSCFIEGEGVRVVVVPVREGRIADWKGGVKDWTLSSETTQGVNGHRPVVNGV